MFLIRICYAPHHIFMLCVPFETKMLQHGKECYN